MLAPAFFLTATGSLLVSANNRLARVVDRLRSLLRELDEGGLDAAQVKRMDRLIALQRRRGHLVLRGSQLLYAAISFFVGTSLAVAIDAFLDYRLGSAAHDPCGAGRAGDVRRQHQPGARVGHGRVRFERGNGPRARACPGEARGPVAVTVEAEAARQLGSHGLHG